ncbi:hypothetical protein [Dactylosporangium sp. NPDC051541]
MGTMISTGRRAGRRPQPDPMPPDPDAARGGEHEAFTHRGGRGPA